MAKLEIKELEKFLSRQCEFHDGSIAKIEIKDDTLILYLETAQMDTEDLPKGFYLDQDDRLKGRLVLKHVSNRSIFQKMIELLKSTNRSGTIFDLTLENNHCQLSAFWDGIDNQWGTEFLTAEASYDEIYFYVEDYKCTAWGILDEDSCNKSTKPNI